MVIGAVSNTRSIAPIGKAGAGTRRIDRACDRYRGCNVLITVAGVVERRFTGTLGSALRKALVISGWVLIWCPLEVLAYDRIAWARNRRILQSIRDAVIAVRTPR